MEKQARILYINLTIITDLRVKQSCLLANCDYRDPAGAVAVLPDKRLRFATMIESTSYMAPVHHCSIF